TPRPAPSSVTLVLTPSRVVSASSSATSLGSIQVSLIISSALRGKVTSGLSVLRLKDSNCKGGDAAGSGMGRIGGDAGSGGDGICGNGDDNGVSGDGGGIGITKNLSASFLVKDSVGG
nr:hypothetical protein [Tanacetum cinerariifolium]